MKDALLQVRLELPREALAAERAATAVGYVLGPETPLPPDPDAVVARFIEPVSLMVTATVAMLASRILNYILVRHGQGVLIDARQQPPLVTQLADVPAGFVVLIKADGSVETVAAGKTDDTTFAGLLAKVLSLRKGAGA